MSKLASRIKRLERRQPARKIPSDESALALWAISSLFPSKPQTDEPVYVDCAPSPYLVFLDLVKSGELEREMVRRGIPMPPEDEPAYKEWTEAHMNEGRWSDEIEIN